MNRPEQAPEPTMDEILASIRRIIADDEQAAEEPVQARAPEARRQDDSDDLMRDIEQALGGGEAEAAAAPQPATEDEIFELTEEVSVTEEQAPQDDGSAVLADFEALTREFSDDSADAGQGDASMDEGVAEDDFQPQPEPPAEIEASLDRGSIPEDFDFEETPVERAHSDDLNAYHDDSSLPSDVVFSESGDSRDEREDEPVPAAAAMPSSAASGFEEGIKEILRPMLRSWLDENMPRLVKGALEAEMRALQTSKDKGRN